MDWRRAWAAVLTELKYCLRHTISCLLAQQMAGRLFASDDSTMLTMTWEAFSHLATRCVRSSYSVRARDLLKFILSLLRLQSQVKHENPITRSLL